MKEDKQLKIFIVAGEASGDQHAAPLMRAIQERSQYPVVFRGIGGDAMREAGLNPLLHCDSISVIGFWEVLKRIRFFARLLKKTIEEIREWKPDIVLTVDYPGFNLRLAKAAKKMGFKTVHYICPQVWVWHRSRIWKIAKALDALITIFPFEPACFEPTTLRPVFAGHPLVDRAAETFASPEEPLPWLATGRRVALLPGSRASEISRLLPDMLAAAALLEANLEEPVSFIIPASSPRTKSLVNSVLDSVSRKPTHLTIVDGKAREVMRQAEAAAVASGTATLEASLMLCPCVLIYRASWLTYRLGRIVLRKAGCIGLANLITGKKIMPELIQHDLSAETLSNALSQYLINAEARSKAIEGLQEANAVLGSGDAATRAAQTVLEVANGKKFHKE